MADRELLIAVIFAVVGFLFVLFNMSLLGRVLRGKTAAYPEKLATYECGELPIGDAWIRYNPRFLLLAIVFVIFGVEVAFLFPWAVVYRESGIPAFFSMLVFLVILLVGYLWFWKLGELRWVLSQSAQSGPASKPANGPVAPSEALEQIS